MLVRDLLLKVAKRANKLTGQLKTLAITTRMTMKNIISEIRDLASVLKRLAVNMQYRGLTRQRKLFANMMPLKSEDKNA